MKTQANGEVAPISHERLNAHQHREPRNLGLLANPAACDADVEHRMEITLDYALATSHPLSEHGSDGEVIVIPNTYTIKAATESSQAAKRKEVSDKRMARLEKLEVFDLVSSGQFPRRMSLGPNRCSRSKPSTPFKDESWFRDGD